MASPISSYSTLVQALKEAIENDSSEFEEYLPVAINNAELRLFREIDTIGKVKYNTRALTSGQSIVVKPSDYVLGRTVLLTNTITNRRKVLQKKPNDFIAAYWPVATSVGEPKYYADYDDTSFLVGPTPAANYSITTEYEARPTALTSANPQNHFTSYCPEALFFAAAQELAATFARNPQLAAEYEKLYVAARDAVNNEARRRRQDDSIQQGDLNPSQNILLPGSE